jgi:hypothetical protein
MPAAILLYSLNSSGLRSDISLEDILLVSQSLDWELVEVVQSTRLRIVIRNRMVLRRCGGNICSSDILPLPAHVPQTRSRCGIQILAIFPGGFRLSMAVEE